MSSKRDEPEPGTSASAQKARRKLGANAEIGRKLKQYYDTILSEEVPDRFSKLLGQLEEAEHKTAGE